MKRPFYVRPNGECVPLEGDWRVEQLDGHWYVLGHHSVVPCGSERAARGTREALASGRDADVLAAEAIAGFDPFGESDLEQPFGEADLA